MEFAIRFFVLKLLGKSVGAAQLVELLLGEGLAAEGPVNGLTPLGISPELCEVAQQLEFLEALVCERRRRGARLGQGARSKFNRQDVPVVDDIPCSSPDEPQLTRRKLGCPRDEPRQCWSKRGIIDCHLIGSSNDVLRAHCASSSVRNLGLHARCCSCATKY